VQQRVQFTGALQRKQVIASTICGSPIQICGTEVRPAFWAMSARTCRLAIDLDFFEGDAFLL
jgi:hypothetical protein